MEIVLKLNSLPDLTMIEITKQLFNNKFLSDVQFHLDGKVLYAHSLELMKRSTVFQKQLMLIIGENKLIAIENVKYDTFYQFIRFIYTDECEHLDTDTRIDMLKLAIKYKVIRLENKLIDLLTNELDCLRLYEFCVNENYLVPYNRIKKKVACSLHVLLAHDSFKTIHLDVLDDILKFDEVNQNVTELKLVEAVMCWINKYCENNQMVVENGHSIFNRLLQQIRFPTMDLTQFGACARKIGSLLSTSDYGIIFKQIVGNSESNNLLWNSIPRRHFSWRLEYCPFIIDADKFITRFSVSNEILLIGIWFGGVCGNNKSVDQLQLSAKTSDTKLIEVLKYRCYGSQFDCKLNSLSDVLLKPNYEYTLQIIYGSVSSVWCRCNNNIIVTDPSKSVQILNAGQNIFELIFQPPTPL